MFGTPSAASSTISSDSKELGRPPTSQQQHQIYVASTATTFSVVTGQIPMDLSVNLQRDFTPEELETIWGRANKYTAPAVEKPACLWIFGSSAVGKSFIAGARAASLFGVLENAVLIDGTQFRFAHAGFQAVALHGQENRVLHADAWPTFKASALEVKDKKKLTLKRRLLREALRDRQHLVIPDCGNNPRRLQELIEEVQAAGYEMHAVCLWAPLSVTRSRGEERSVTEGKLWTSTDYQASVRCTLALAMQWIDGMRDEPNSFCSLELWDNTAFPATEVGLERYASLVLLSHEEADAHLKNLMTSRERAHAMTTAGNARARDELDRRSSIQTHIGQMSAGQYARGSRQSIDLEQPGHLFTAAPRLSASGTIEATQLKSKH